MMSFHIPLLEKFGVSFVVLSYYGHTHQSFILLSKLSRQSRSMLDYNYEGFLNSMVNNNYWFDEYRNESYIFSLPWDLFRYKFKLFYDIVLKKFLNMVENIVNWKGYYFNKHFMHSRLWIDDLCIIYSLVKQLEPYFEMVKATEVTECTVIDNNFILTKKSSLYDLIHISECQAYLVFEDSIANNSDKLKLNQKYNSFRKLDKINLDYEFTKTTIYLKNLKHYEFKIKEIDLHPKLSEELVSLTNPKILKEMVKIINIILEEPLTFGDEFLRISQKLSQ